ncbi:MAG TPA: BPTI/Kunitz-type proteinase inhibitor domain-containing protein [Thermodesulfobacteriota bacterium]|nr:BPTI/Kunitz-type proteinase inhibitor domain-containing protein [Thermodesulfobacteriota bacterium]
MIKNILPGLLLLAVLIIPCISNSSPLSECNKESENKKELSKCLDAKLKKAEASLDNKVLEIRKKMEQKSIKSNQIYPIRSFNLSQQSYLIYRKTNCNWYFDKSFPGSGSSELLKNCLIKMTLDRILELDSSIETVNPSADKTDKSSSSSNNDNNNNRSNAAKTNTSSNKKHNNDTDNIRQQQRDSDNRKHSDNNNRAADTNYADTDKYDNLDERCYIKPDPGTCEEFIMKYFFYPEGGNCSSFIWSGCGGVVPFESMAECKEICQ